MSGPVFALDFDGTVADTNSVKAAWIRSRLGMEVPPECCDRSSCVPLIGASSYERLADEVYEREATAGTAPVPGALAAIDQLAAAGAVWVVSARTERRIEFAREWLAAHGAEPRIRGLLSSAGSTKRAVCAAIGAGVLVDDDRRHLRDLAPGCLGVLLRPAAAGETRDEDGVAVCAGWAAVLARLAKGSGGDAYNGGA